MKKALFLFEAFLSVFAWTGVALATLFFTALIAAVYSVHRWWDPHLQFAHRLACLWGRLLVAMTPSARVQRVGLPQLPQKGPIILMANHQSYTDVPVLFSLCRPFKWMADEDLFKIPFFGWSMRLCGYIPVRRGDLHEAKHTLEKAKEWLSKGISVFIFPEGTRSHTGAFGRFRTGGFQLAADTQTPIVPVVVVGTRQLLPRGSWVFRLGARPQIHILPAISVPGSSLRQVRQLARTVRSQMERVYRQQLRCLAERSRL